MGNFVAGAIHGDTSVLGDLADGAPTFMQQKMIPGTFAPDTGNVIGEYAKRVRPAPPGGFLQGGVPMPVES